MSSHRLTRHTVTDVLLLWLMCGVDCFMYQMIIAVSQLIGNSVIISDSRFTESLSIISSYASNDKAVQVPAKLSLSVYIQCSCYMYIVSQ